MNNENLISIGDRSEADKARITRQGGIKSGEIRRRNKAIKRIIQEITSAKVTDEKLYAILEELGVEPTYLSAIAYSIIRGAILGRAQSVEAFMKYSGQDELYNARLRRAGAEERDRETIETGINDLIYALSVRAAEDWKNEEENDDSM